MPSSLLARTPPAVPESAGQIVRWGKVYGCSAALALAELAAQQQRNILVLTASVAEAETLAQGIEWFQAGQPSPALFPDLEVLPYDDFSPHQDIVAQRLSALSRMTGAAGLVTISSISALLPHLPPTSYLRQRSISLAAGQALAPDDFRHQLEDSGYQRVSQVIEHGDYAVRGSLVDFFPSGHADPVRVDFFDREIETLREFDADTQITTRRIESLDTLPAREIPLDAAAVRFFRQRYRQRFEGNPARSLIYREITERRLFF